MRLFSQHPQLKETDYLFMAAFMHGPESLMIKTPEMKAAETRQSLAEKNKDEYFQVPFDKLKEFLKETETEVR
jgi:hypothetical protein